MRVELWPEQATFLPLSCDLTTELISFRQTFVPSYFGIPLSIAKLHHGQTRMDARTNASMDIHRNRHCDNHDELITSGLDKNVKIHVPYILLYITFCYSLYLLENWYL